MEPQGLGCGVVKEIPQQSQRKLASMEPQGLGCGVPIRNTPSQYPGTCFNGATGFRLWSPTSAAERCQHATCFNGATGFRLWSRSKRNRRPRRRGRASMEPQGLGCGVMVFRPRFAIRRQRFNGATAGSPFIGTLAMAGIIASMEPQGLGCGVTARGKRSRDSVQALQWSHRV